MAIDMIIKKQFKKVVICFIVLSVMVVGLGCEKKKEKQEISEDSLLKMVDKLVTCEGFESKLEPVDATIILNTYKISDSDISVAAGYIGDGASAEEITLFKCKDADKIKDYAEEYLKEKEESYKGYLPKEADKIGKAIVEEYQGYLLICISNDEKTVREIIKEKIK